jgi:hypothetical protein
MIVLNHVLLGMKCCEGGDVKESSLGGGQEEVKKEKESLLRFCNQRSRARQLPL